jgi:hypothetical protein
MRFRRIASVLFLLALLAPGPRASADHPQIDTGFGPLPVFEFHSGFWVNLHHTLYYEARQKNASTSDTAKSSASNRPVLKNMPDPKLAFTDAERRAWNDAVAYYAANFANKDLLFSNDLIDLNNQLSDFEDCPDLSGLKQKFCNAGLPADLTHTLESAAPVYREHLWLAHDRANRRWIFGVAPLVREQGLGLSERLADIYQTPWPRRKIRVDVSAYANWAGAYTTVDPLHVTISSLDPGNQGSAALEILFHEGSHGIAQGVEAAIIRECRQRDKAIPRDLWHALVFYTTGEVLRPILTSSGSSAASVGSTSINERLVDSTRPSGTSDPRSGTPDASPKVLEATPGSNAASRTAGASYTPYAFAHGLYQRGWQNYLDLLQRFWQPYLDGRVSFEDAIAHIVSAL